MDISAHVIVNNSDGIALHRDSECNIKSSINFMNVCGISDHQEVNTFSEHCYSNLLSQCLISADHAGLQMVASGGLEYQVNGLKAICHIDRSATVTLEMTCSNPESWPSSSLSCRLELSCASWPLPPCVVSVVPIACVWYRLEKSERPDCIRDVWTGRCYLFGC